MGCGTHQRLKIYKIALAILRLMEVRPEIPVPDL